MNYFTLFEIPVSLIINKEVVKAKFYELSRKYHPDFFSQENESEKDGALEMSALLNKAYKTLQNDDELLKYVLQLKGVLAEDEKYQLPADFLMEVMELNEFMVDAKSSADVNQMDQINNKVNQLEQEILEPVKPILESYNDASTTSQQLLVLKDYFFKKKYLKRILAAM